MTIADCSDLSETLAGLPDAQRRQLVLSLLSIDDAEFAQGITAAARRLTRREFGDTVFACGLLAFSNRCAQDCLYCGLRKSNAALPRFRLGADQIDEAAARLRDNGISRIFFVSGEHESHAAADVCAMVARAKRRGLHVTLGIGEYGADEYRAFREAGTDCFALKFETSNAALFDRIKPTTNYGRRLACIRAICSAGLELGSGNIVGLAGQSLDDIAGDILLMRDLDIAWAPVVPYLPAPGTPMAEHTPMGDVRLTLRVLSLVRLLLPRCLITAGQPAQGSKLGFADPAGNRAALQAGANLLFVDLTPLAVRKDFRVMPGRILPGLSQIDALIAEMGLSRA